MAITLVSSVTVSGSAAGSIDFTNVPQTGKDLFIAFSLRATGGVTESTSNWSITAGTPTTYFYRRLRGDSFGSPGSQNGTEAFPALFPGNTATSNTFGNGHFYISNYTGSAPKLGSIDSVSENNNTQGSKAILCTVYGGTSAITTITVSAQNGNLAIGSTVSLYIVS